MNREEYERFMRANRLDPMAKLFVDKEAEKKKKEREKRRPIKRFRIKKPRREKATESDKLMAEAFMLGLRGIRVLIMAHTDEHAYSLAATVRKRLEDRNADSSLVTSSGPLAPKEIPLDTRVVIHKNVDKVSVKGAHSAEYPRKAFIALWDLFRKEEIAQRSKESPREEPAENQTDARKKESEET